MNPYEITLIVRPDLDEEQTRATAEQVTTRLQNAGGEIIAAYAWSPARRRMAYPIRDFGDGFYFTATFKLPSPQLREFENALKLNDRILRFLIVQATDLNIRQSQQRMQQQVAAAAGPPPPPPGSTPSHEPVPVLSQGGAPLPPPVQPGAPVAQSLDPVAPSPEAERVSAAVSPDTEE